MNPADEHHCHAVRDEPCLAIQLISPGSHIIFSSALLQFRDARGRDLPYTPAEKIRPTPDPRDNPEDQEMSIRGHPGDKK